MRPARSERPRLTAPARSALRFCGALTLVLATAACAPGWPALLAEGRTLEAGRALCGAPSEDEERRFAEALLARLQPRIHVELRSPEALATALGPAAAALRGWHVLHARVALEPLESQSVTALVRPSAAAEARSAMPSLAWFAARTGETLPGRQAIYDSPPAGLVVGGWLLTVLSFGAFGDALIPEARPTGRHREPSDDERARAAPRAWALREAFGESLGLCPNPRCDRVVFVEAGAPPGALAVQVQLDVAFGPRLAESSTLYLELPVGAAVDSVEALRSHVRAGLGCPFRALAPPEPTPAR
jgi:hypothetical protein